MDTSVVFAGAEPLGTGHGASKQEAEQDAARVALESLVGSITEMPTSKTASKPRSRRAPRKKREPSHPALEPTPAEVVPLPAATTPELSREPEPRSRQFGEPID